MVASVAPVIVNVAPFVIPDNDAVTTDLLCVATVRVCTVNVPEDDPAETTTVEGITTFELTDESPTVTPPEAALPLSVTVPVDDRPAAMLAGENDRSVSVGGVTVRVAVAEEPPTVAVIVAGDVEDTGEVLTVKLA